MNGDHYSRIVHSLRHLEDEIHALVFDENSNQEKKPNSFRINFQTIKESDLDEKDDCDDNSNLESSITKQQVYNQYGNLQETEKMKEEVNKIPIDFHKKQKEKEEWFLRRHILQEKAQAVLDGGPSAPNNSPHIKQRNSTPLKGLFQLY